MKKQRRRQLVSAALTGLCLVQAPVLSGCSEKTQSSQEETDSQVSTEAGAAETAEDKDRYLYYLKDNALYRADAKNPEKADPELLVEQVNENEGEGISSSLDMKWSEDGSYVLVPLYQEEEESQYMRLYVIENCKGGKAERIAENASWYKMEGNTVVFNEKSRKPDVSPEALYCYRPEEGVFVISQQGGSSYPALMTESCVCFSVQRTDFKENPVGEDVYYSDLTSKEASSPVLLGEDVAYIEGMSGDGSKIWYTKEDKDTDRLQLFLWEKGKDSTQLLDMDLENGYVTSLSGETGEVYYVDRNPEDMAAESGSLFDDMKAKQEKRENGQSGLRDALYYYKDGETVMLSPDVYDCAYGEEEGIFWYEEEREDEEGAVVRYLVKDGQSWELKGVPYDGCEYPQIYSPEEECCYLVCYEAEEDDEAFYGRICEYKLVKADMSEGHMGEMELLDTSPEEILLSSAENSQLLYEKSIDTEDSENFGKTELYLNEEKIAEDPLTYGTLDTDSGEVYLIAPYEDRSYQYLGYRYDTSGRLQWFSQGQTETVAEEVTNVSAADDFLVLLTDYKNPEFYGNLNIYKDGQTYLIDDHVESFYIREIEKSLSAPSYYLQKDEEQEDGEDMSSMFSDLFGQTEAQDDGGMVTIEFPVEDEADTGGISAEETEGQQA